jgi:hypothetical protein
VIATVFLGAFVGLNLDGRQWCGRSEFYGYRGWPFPAVLVVYERGDYEGPDRDPWTHQTYELVLADRLGWMLNWEAYGAGYASIYVFCAIADALLGIVVLGTVLCFQVPAARKAERRIWFSPKSLAAGMILLFALVAISLHATWTANIYAGKSDGTIPGCPYDSSRSYGWPFRQRSHSLLLLPRIASRYGQFPVDPFDGPAS